MTYDDDSIELSNADLWWLMLVDYEWALADSEIKIGDFDDL